MLGCFLLQEVAHSAPLAPPGIPSPLESILQDPARFETPVNFSTLREVHKGQNGTLVIHLQDAHSNFSGQENLANTLDEIIRKYGVSLVLSEGGSQDCSLTAIKSVAPAAVWKKIARSYMMQGKLSGEEYLNLVSDHPMKIVGIEDLELYAKSVQSYSDLAGKREEIFAYLALAHRGVDKLKGRLYPQALLDYEKDKKARDYESNFKVLFSLAAANRVDLSEFSSLSQLTALIARESTIDFDLANLEQAALVEAIRSKGGDEDLKGWLTQLSESKNQKLSLLAYLEKAFNIAVAKGVRLEKYSNLQRYEDYLNEFSKLDLEQVLTELEKAEDKIYASMMPGPDARMVKSIDRYLGLLDTAYHIQMSTQDFRTFKANEPDFSTLAYLSFLNRKLSEQGYFEDLIPYKTLLEDGKKSLEAFYDSVEKRDFAFLRNAERTLQEEKQKIAVLITGGYHTPHLKKLLESRGYSTVVLTPIVTSETNQAKYEKRLLAPFERGLKKIRLVEGGAPFSALERSKDGVRTILTAIHSDRVPDGAQVATLLQFGREQLERLIDEAVLEVAGNDRSRADALKSRALSALGITSGARLAYGKTSPLADVKHLIMDLDGVLVDTIPLNREYAARVYRMILLGLDETAVDNPVVDAAFTEGLRLFDKNLGQRFIDLAGSSIETAKARGVAAEKLLTAEQYYEIYAKRRDQAIEQMLKENPDALLKVGTRKFLASAKKNGVQLDISSGAADTRLKILRAAGIYDSFQEIRMSRTVEDKLGEIGNLIKNSRYPENQTAFVDDSPGVVTDARKLYPKLNIVGVPSGPQFRQQMGDANVVVNSMSELAGLLSPAVNDIAPYGDTGLPFTGGARLAANNGLGLVGLIGVGKQGQRHLKTMVDDLGMEVVAVDRAIAPELRTKYDGNERVKLLQGDAAEVFANPEVRLVVVVTPGATHYDVVKAALLAGKNVLVEKPFTRTTEQARELVALAEERNLMLMVGHNRYYLPHIQQLIQLVRGNKLGKIVSVEANYLNPHQKYDTTHTALEGLGYHILYMVEAIIGRENPEIVSAVRTEDWETAVGFKLKYGDLPVLIKLSREYGEQKTRSIIVRGSVFTATFDYSEEPLRTSLRIEPTASDLYDEQELKASEVLDDLRKPTVLQGEDIQPSLYHQAKAFFTAVRTNTTPASDGRKAIRLVETLEAVHGRIETTPLFHGDAKVSIEVITQLVEIIHDRIGTRGGIVTIDAPSGTGKTTLSGPLADFYQLRFPGRRVVIDPLDELFVVRESMALKKLILGDPLSEEDEEILSRRGWDTLRPGQTFTGEEQIWQNEVIYSETQMLRRLFEDQYSPEELFILREHAYVKRPDPAIVRVRRPFRKGDLIIREGKFSNREDVAPFMDLRMRLRRPLDKVAEQFRKNRSTILAPEALEKHMTYYGKVIVPSWEAYAPRTESLIDVEVDVESGRLNLRSTTGVRGARLGVDPAYDDDPPATVRIHLVSREDRGTGGARLAFAQDPEQLNELGRMMEHIRELRPNTRQIMRGLYMSKDDLTYTFVDCLFRSYSADTKEMVFFDPTTQQTMTASIDVDDKTTELPRLVWAQTAKAPPAQVSFSVPTKLQLTFEEFQRLLDEILVPGIELGVRSSLAEDLRPFDSNVLIRKNGDQGFEVKFSGQNWENLDNYQDHRWVISNDGSLFTIYPISNLGASLTYITADKLLKQCAGASIVDFRLTSTEDFEELRANLAFHIGNAERNVLRRGRGAGVSLVVKRGDLETFNVGFTAEDRIEDVIERSAAAVSWQVQGKLFSLSTRGNTVFVNELTAGARLASPKAIAFFPGFGRLTEYARVGTFLYDTRVPGVQEVYRRAAEVQGFSDPSKIFLVKDNLPEAFADRWEFMGQGVTVHNLALSAYFDYRTRKLGNPVEFRAYSGDSFGIVSAAIQSGAVSFEDGIRASRSVPRLLALEVDKAVPEKFFVLDLHGPGLKDALEKVRQAYPDFEVYRNRSAEAVYAYLPTSQGEFFDWAKANLPGITVANYKAPTKSIMHSKRLKVIRDAVDRLLRQEGIEFSDPLVPVIASDGRLLKTAEDVRSGFLDMADGFLDSANAAAVADAQGADLLVEFDLAGLSKSVFAGNQMRTPLYSFTGNPTQDDLLISAFREGPLTAFAAEVAGARLASEAEPDRFELVFGVGLEKDTIRTQADLERLIGSVPVSLVARAFVAPDAALVGELVPFNFDRSNAAIRVEPAQDNAKEALINFYAIEDGKEVLIGSIRLTEAALDAARQANQQAKDALTVEAVRQEASPALSAFGEAQRVQRLAVKSLASGKPVILKVGLDREGLLPAQAETILAEVRQVRDLLKSRGDANVAIQVVSKDGKSVYADLSDDTSRIGSQDHEVMYVGVPNAELVREASAANDRSQKPSGFLPIQDGQKDASGNYAIVPLVATLIAAIMVARSDTLQDNDKLEILLNNLIGTEFKASETKSDDFRDLKEVRNVDVARYIRLAVKAIAKLDINKLLEYSKLMVRAVGAAA